MILYKINLHKADSSYKECYAWGKDKIEALQCIITQRGSDIKYIKSLNIEIVSYKQDILKING